MRDLRSTRLSPAYTKRLAAAWSLFVAFYQARAPLPLESLRKDSVAAVKWMCLFLQSLYETDRLTKQAVGRHALLSMEKEMKELKGTLQEAWETLESWRQEIPSQMRVPLFLPALLSMAVVARLLARSAQGTSGYKWMAASVLLEVGFFSLLRPGEMFALTRQLVSLPGQLLGNAAAFAVVGIIGPKNKKQLGKYQFSVCRSANATAWLTWFCDGLLPCERLWPGTAKDFRKRFKLLLKYLGLEDLNFSPASLRAGGATYLFMHGVDPSRLKFYGRWASERTLAHYLQESVTFQLAHNASARAQRLVALALEVGADFLAPPAQPLSSLFPRPAARKGLAAAVSTDQGLRAPALVTPARSWEALYPPPR
jgi:hypothetical protein